MNEQYKKDFLHAGAIAREVRFFGKSLIKPGASYNEVIEKINHKIFELKARPAFPPQIALNDVAAHFLPQPNEDLTFLNQVIKLDIGVCFNGAIGDCAVTVDLSGKHQTLVDSAEAALLAAEKSVKVGLPLGQLGKIIEETIFSYGFVSIKNLSGHGLGKYKIHTPPMIPNFDNKSQVTIKPGMTFAIEPFATNGRGFIYETGHPAIFSLNTRRSVRSISNLARMLLAKIQLFEGLPFAIHDLINEEWPIFKVKQGLVELIADEVVNAYPPLLEEAHGIVVQAENSVLVDEQGEVFITTR